MSKKSACKAKLRYESEDKAKAAADRACAFYSEDMQIYRRLFVRDGILARKNSRQLFRRVKI